MIWIDRIEKTGRLVLWLTLASAVVLVPIAYTRQRSVETQTAEAARKEEQALARKLKADAEKSDRLSMSSMGAMMTVLNEGNGTGRVWFTNVSPRTGVVCIAGTATNPTSKVTTESLASCKNVPAYASNVEIQMMFAGANLAEVCKGVTCAFSIKEVPDVAAGALVASAK
jgi:hypothetical protein